MAHTCVPLDRVTRRVCGDPRRRDLDLARGVAVLGMIFVDLKYALGAAEPEAPGLAYLSGRGDGRFAALFVVIAGWAVADLVRRVGTRETERILLRRGVALAITGIALSGVWPVDILHMYPLFLVLAFMATSWPERARVVAMIGFILGYVALLLSLGVTRVWMDSVATSLAPGVVARHVLYAGTHPLVPWGAFAVLGVWLGNRDPGGPAWRRLVVTAAATLILVAAADARFGRAGGGYWSILLDFRPSPPVPGFVVRAGATAILVLAGCRWVTSRAAGSVAWLEALGRRSLSTYLAHIPVCMGLAFAFDEEAAGVGTALLVTIALAAVASRVAIRWERLGYRGPAENLLRRFSPVVGLPTPVAGGG